MHTDSGGVIHKRAGCDGAGTASDAHPLRQSMHKGTAAGASGAVLGALTPRQSMHTKHGIRCTSLGEKVDKYHYKTTTYEVVPKALIFFNPLLIKENKPCASNAVAEHSSQGTPTTVGLRPMSSGCSPPSAARHLQTMRLTAQSQSVERGSAPNPGPRRAGKGSGVKSTPPTPCHEAKRLPVASRVRLRPVLASSALRATCSSARPLTRLPAKYHPACSTSVDRQHPISKVRW